MKTRPKLCVFLALSFIVIGLAIPAQVFFLYGHGLSEFGAALHKLTVLNWASTILCVSCGVLAFNASPSLRIVAPMSLVVVGWNNWIVASLGQDYTKLTVILSFVAFAGLHSLWFAKPILAALKEPTRRWWITPRRRQVSVNALVQTWLGESFTAQTFDISRTGVFLDFSAAASTIPAKVLKNLQAGRHLTLKIMLSPFRTIRCDAEIVRVATATANHPAGVGLRFVSYYGLAREEIRNLLAG